MKVVKYYKLEGNTIMVRKVTCSDVPGIMHEKGVTRKPTVREADIIMARDGYTRDKPKFLNRAIVIRGK